MSLAQIENEVKEILDRVGFKYTEVRVFAGDSLEITPGDYQFTFDKLAELSRLFHTRDINIRPGNSEEDTFGNACGTNTYISIRKWRLR